jgi:hypothetical protein
MSVEYFSIRRVTPVVKTTSIVSKLFRGIAIAVCVGASVSCMTTYDSAGRPVQSVDPGVAIAGAAAAGLAGYAIANNNDNHNHYYHGGGYYRPRPYYGGYQRRGYYR